MVAVFIPQILPELEESCRCPMRIDLPEGCLNPCAMSISRFPVFLASASLALTISFQSGMANEAFFSKDGRTVTMGLGSRGRSGLVQVDIATGKITQAPLPAELKDCLLYTSRCV